MNSQEITLSGRVSGTVTDSKPTSKEEGKGDKENENEKPKDENSKDESGKENEEKPELPAITDILKV